MIDGEKKQEQDKKKVKLRMCDHYTDVVVALKNYLNYSQTLQIIECVSRYINKDNNGYGGGNESQANS